MIAERMMRRSEGARREAGALLRRVLQVDAWVSGGAGVLLLVLGGELAEPLGASATLLRVVGAAFLPWCAALTWLARRERPEAGPVWAVIGVNLVWVAASVAVAIGGWLDLTGLGLALLLAQAAAVAGFAEAQYVGLRRRTAENAPQG